MQKLWTHREHRCTCRRWRWLRSPSTVSSSSCTRSARGWKWPPAGSPSASSGWWHSAPPCPTAFSSTFESSQTSRTARRAGSIILNHNNRLEIMICTDHTRIGRQDVGLRPANLRSRHVRHAVCRPVRHHGLRLHQGNHNNDSTSTHSDFSREKLGPWCDTLTNEDGRVTRESFQHLKRATGYWPWWLLVPSQAHAGGKKKEENLLE